MPTPTTPLADPSEPVNKLPKQNLVNRPHLSALQVSILRHLASIGPPGPVDQYGQQYIGHWPTTGTIILAIGRRKDRVAYAAVSRALARLSRTGLVLAAECLFMPGKGLRYGLSG